VAKGKQMRQELQDKLQTIFPTFFRNRHSLPSCYDGWFMIVWDLCQAIQALNPSSDFEVIQAKEKFGTLRFYVQCANEQIYQLIREAEQKSAETCEECGQPGEQRNNGWIKTLCDRCQELRDKQ
jgi:hypothetical protein